MHKSPLTPMRALLAIIWLTAILHISGCDSSPESEWVYGQKGLYTATISPTGEHAVIGSIRHGGSLWRLQDNERLYNWNHSQGQYTDLVATSISHDGSAAITADTRRIVLWDIATGESKGFWAMEDDVLSATLGGNGSFMLVGQKGYNAVFIHTGKGIVENLPHNGSVKDVAITADGTIGVTGSDDRVLRIWDLQSFKLIKEIKQDNTINKVAVSANGQYAFASSQHDQGVVYQLPKGERLFSFSNRAYTVSAARFSKDGKRLLVGTTQRGIMLFSLPDGEKQQSWTIPRKSFWRPIGSVIYGLGFGSDNKSLYSISSLGVGHQWLID